MPLDLIAPRRVALKVPPTPPSRVIPVALLVIARGLPATKDLIAPRTVAPPTRAPTTWK